MESRLCSKGAQANTEIAIHENLRRFTEIHKGQPYLHVYWLSSWITLSSRVASNRGKGSLGAGFGKDVQGIRDQEQGVKSIEKFDVSSVAKDDEIRM